METALLSHRSAPPNLNLKQTPRVFFCSLTPVSGMESHDLSRHMTVLLSRVSTLSAVFADANIP